MTERKTMTVKEVAAALGAHKTTILRHLSDLRANSCNVATVEHGKTVYITEDEATEIKKRIERSGRTDLQSVQSAASTSTDLEMAEKTRDVMDWLAGKINQLRKENAELTKTVNVLTHVNKTYTATEIAKELNMKSANELNAWLSQQRIQYKANGTWVMYSDYSNLGYTEIKQTTLDSGRVVYDWHFTQRGREFIVKLYAAQYPIPAIE